MTLTEQLTDYVHAAFTGLWVQTSEPDEAERDLLQHARQQNWKAVVWDVASGLRLATGNGSPGLEAAAGDPLAALRPRPALAGGNGTPFLVLPNFTRLLVKS